MDSQNQLSVIKSFLAQSANLIEEDICEDEIVSGSALFSSLTLVELIVHIEDVYNIEIPPDDLTVNNFETVRTIADYVQDRTS